MLAGLNAPARLSGQPLAALRPAARNHLAAACSGHAAAKAMAALADKLRRLKCALHSRSPYQPSLLALDPWTGQPARRAPERAISLASGMARHIW